jgi:hypothetical protein
MTQSDYNKVCNNYKNNIIHKLLSLKNSELKPEIIENNIKDLLKLYGLSLFDIYTNNKLNIMVRFYRVRGSDIFEVKLNLLKELRKEKIKNFI